MLTADVAQLTDALVSSDERLGHVYAFLEREEAPNSLQASLLSKVLGLLITRKSELVSNRLVVGFTVAV